MTREDIEERVRQISRPAPSALLRDRVLSAAVVLEQPISWSDRVWFSRAWRLSAVGAAFAIVVLDQFSSSPRPAGLPATPQALAEAQVIDETGRLVGLPPEVAASFARRAMAEALRPQVQSHSPSELLQALDLVSSGGAQ